MVSPPLLGALTERNKRMGRTYFDLVKDCLREMFYEEAETWADTNTTEGKKIKQLLNQALEDLVLGQNIPWKFRERTHYLVCVENIQEYPMVPGYIHSMRYTDNTIRLYYDERYVNLPHDTHGMPILYYIYGGKINLYPIPSEQYNGKQIKVRFLTNYCATDCCGVLKQRMENADDEPIIPNEFRNMLVYKVCADFRRNHNDPASAYYVGKYNWLYKALLDAQRLTDDYPNGLDISPYPRSLQEVIMDTWRNPRVANNYSNGGTV